MGFQKVSVVVIKQDGAVAFPEVETAWTAQFVTWDLKQKVSAVASGDFLFVVLLRVIRAALKYNLCVYRPVVFCDYKQGN